jgi:hypothetical protein
MAAWRRDSSRASSASWRRFAATSSLACCVLMFPGMQHVPPIDPRCLEPSCLRANTTPHQVHARPPRQRLLHGLGSLRAGLLLLPERGCARKASTLSAPMRSIGGLATSSNRLSRSAFWPAIQRRSASTESSTCSRFLAGSGSRPCRRSGPKFRRMRPFCRVRVEFKGKYICHKCSCLA